MSTTRTPRAEMNVMARAFAESMNRPYCEMNDRPQIGDWFIARADTDKPLYRLTEMGEHGGISHPITSAPMSAQGLADALYFARLAVGMERAEIVQAVHEMSS
jgi:hypothetical protein